MPLRLRIFSVCVEIEAKPTPWRSFAGEPLRARYNVSTSIKLNAAVVELSAAEPEAVRGTTAR